MKKTEHLSTSPEQAGRTLDSDLDVVIRIYAPFVEYPEYHFYRHDAIYLSCDHCVFTAVKVDQYIRSFAWSEQAWIFPEEVRLLAALALAIPESEGTIGFAPGREYRVIRLPLSTQLDAPPTVDALRDHATSMIQEAFGEIQYSLRSTNSSGREFEQELFKSIDLDNQLLLRGLYTLLKSQHLNHRELGSFMEEATMNVQISREASLELIREKLRTNGNPNPSFKDAHTYVVDNFAFGNHLAEFFKQLHELWVQMKHPNSAFGPLWTPFAMVDDYYETYEALVSVYRHLLTGEPGRATLAL